jgi:hypothetical protein
MFDELRARVVFDGDGLAIGDAIARVGSFNGE